MSKSFVTTAALERLVAKYQANRAKREELADKVPEWERQSEDLLKDGGVEDEQKFAALTTLQNKIRFTPGSLRQFDEAATVIEQDVDYELECLKRVMGHAVRQIEEEIHKSILRALEPYNDKHEREHFASQIQARSVQAEDFSIYTSHGRYSTGALLPSVDKAIRDFARLQSALKKHAALFPKNFQPLPETEEEFRALCPPRVDRTPAAPAKLAPEQVLANLEHERSIQNFRLARTRGDQREVDRLWKTMLNHAARAAIIHSECHDLLTLDEVDRVLRINLGTSYTAARQAVQAAENVRAAKLEAEHAAQPAD